METLKELFDLKQEHIDLLKHVNLKWEEDPDYGGPAVDGKRPYGERLLLESVAEALNWKPAECDCGVENCNFEDWTDDQEEAAKALHKDILPAMQIVLQTQSFTPGIYARDTAGQWHRLHVQSSN